GTVTITGAGKTVTASTDVTTGVLTVSAGATFTANGNVNCSSTSGAFTIDFSGGTFNLAAGKTLTTSTNSGFVTLNAPANVIAGNLTVAGSGLQLGGPNPLDLTGTVTVNTGTSFFVSVGTALTPTQLGPVVIQSSASFEVDACTNFLSTVLVTGTFSSINSSPANPIVMRFTP